MLKLYVNSDFRMLVDTWLFLTLDLWVFKSTTAKGESYLQSFTDDFFNTNANLDNIDYYHNPIKITDAVMSIDQKSSTNIVYTAQKSFNYVTIASASDVYTFNVEETYSEVYAVWIKRFDTENYIAPVAIYADQTYLKENDYVFDISHLIQEVNNTESIKDLLSEFKKTILT